MRASGSRLVTAFAALAVVIAAGVPATAAPPFGDWRDSAPGKRWEIKPADLPRPFATSAASNPPGLTPWNEALKPTAPPGFTVELFAKGLPAPRKLAVAPNGDVFAAESGAGRIHVFRPGTNGLPATDRIFASGLNLPYGIAFYPPGKPQYVYVAETARIVRYPYGGELAPTGPAEVVVPRLPGGGHWTRDIVFSEDGARLFIAVGSASNVGDGMARTPPQPAATWDAERGTGAAWGPEELRAAVLVADADGKGLKTFANGIRNCAGLALEKSTGLPWCATNERDGLGDDLPPDYITRVKAGGFYGWPWYYIGGNVDPRRAGERPDLATRVSVPDVLVQPHSAPLGLAFYHGSAFPAAYQGELFGTLHGSWNRGQRTGYKVVRVLMKDGQPTGAYEDFLTGFVTSTGAVWGRPVGVAVAADGSLLVSEDGAGTIWRVSAKP